MVMNYDVVMVIVVIIVIVTVTVVGDVHRCAGDHDDGSNDGSGGGVRM